MAKYINPIATGLAIGQGEAQVFDSSKIWKAKWDAEKEAKLEKEKKEKELLNSLVNIDTSKLWDRDLEEFNTKHGDYRQFVKDNYDKLRNPSKNPDIWMEKRRKEQELLQFSNSSAQAAKLDIEVQKMLLNDKTGMLKDTEGLYAAWKKKSGDFSNPLDFISRMQEPEEITPLTDLIASTKKSGLIPANINYSVEDDDGQTIKQKGVKKSDYIKTLESEYNTKPEYQASANQAWLAAGGAEGSGFDNPKDFFKNEILKYYEKPSYEKRQEGGGSDFNWTFGAGGSTFDKTQFSKKDIIGKTTDYEGDDRVVVRNRVGSQMKNLPYMEMNLQGAVRDSDGQNVDLTGGTIKVAIEDLVRKTNTDGSPSYQVRLRKPISREDEKNKEAKLEEVNDNIDGKKSEIATEKDKWKINPTKKGKEGMKLLDEELAELEKQKRLLEKGYEILTVPLDNETNIAQVETAIGVQDLFNQLPKIFGEPDKTKTGEAKELD